MPIDPLHLNQLESSATGRAIDAVIKGQVVLDTFVDFTTDLVRNVVQTVVQSSMDQLQAYAELVANVSGTLADYEQRMFPDVDGESVKYINGYIKPNFGDVVNWTADVTQTGTTAVALDPTKIADFKQVFSGLVVNFKQNGASAVADHSIGDIITEVAATTTAPATATIIPADLFEFARAKIKRDIKASYDKLVMVLKIGMQKIVITDGKIYTKLTFHVGGADTDALQSSSTQVDYSARSSGWGVGLSGSIMRKAFGLGFNGGYSSSRSNSTLKVNVVNEQKSAVTTLDVDITGGVELRFRSDYFPSFDPTTVTVGP